MLTLFYLNEFKFEQLHKATGDCGGQGHLWAEGCVIWTLELETWEIGVGALTLSLTSCVTLSKQAKLIKPALARSNYLLGLQWGLNNKFVEEKVLYQLQSSMTIYSVI